MRLVLRARVQLIALLRVKGKKDHTQSGKSQGRLKRAQTRTIACSSLRSVTLIQFPYLRGMKKLNK